MSGITQAEATDILESIALALLGDASLMLPEELLNALESDERSTNMVIYILKGGTGNNYLVPDGDWSRDEDEAYRELCQIAGIID